MPLSTIFDLIMIIFWSWISGIVTAVILLENIGDIIKPNYEVKIDYYVISAVLPVIKIFNL